MMSTPNVAGFQNRLRWNVTNPPKAQGPNGGGCSKAIAVVVSSKPGVEKWWKKCRQVEGLLDMEDLDPEVRKRIPKRLMLCLSRTQNQGGQIKAAGKRQRGDA